MLKFGAFLWFLGLIIVLAALLMPVMHPWTESGGLLDTFTSFRPDWEIPMWKLVPLVLLGILAIAAFRMLFTGRGRREE